MNQPVSGNGRRQRRSGIVASCLSIALVAISGALVAIVLFASVTGVARSTWAFGAGLELARTSPAVTTALGRPITVGWLVRGSVRFSGSSGEASVVVPLGGPEGSGTLYIEAGMEDGEWRLTLVEFTSRADGARTDLLEEKGELLFVRTRHRRCRAGSHPVAILGLHRRDRESRSVITPAQIAPDRSRGVLTVMSRRRPSGFSDPTERLQKVHSAGARLADLTDPVVRGALRPRGEVVCDALRALRGSPIDRRLMRIARCSEQGARRRARGRAALAVTLDGLTI